MSRFFTLAYKHDMAHRKSKKFEYDKHIVDALLKLKSPILGKDGKKFYIRESAKDESGLEHIANKQHRLKVKDIEDVPNILKHPKAEMVDPNNKNYRNYYGVRKGKETDLLIKIVTWPDKSNPKKEVIITIFPTKTIKID